MATITQIKPQKNQKRVNVYLDGKFGFGLDLENYLKLNLKVDQQLSEKEIKNIIKKSEFQKTLDKLLNFATLRPRSVGEVSDWLRRKKVNESIHRELFDRLNKLDLLNDEKFALWWVNQRMSFKKKSKKELVYELRGKGIDSEIIKNTLESVDPDEEKIVKDLIKQKSYRWARYDKVEKLQKIREFLLRKGFGWNIVSKVVK